MNSFRYFPTALVLAAVWLAPLAALAQQAGGEEGGGKSYVLGYALTTLCIGLGLFAVARPGKRKTPKIKRQLDDDEAPVH